MSEEVAVVSGGPESEQEARDFMEGVGCDEEDFFQYGLPMEEA